MCPTPTARQLVETRKASYRVKNTFIEVSEEQPRAACRCHSAPPRIASTAVRGTQAKKRATIASLSNPKCPGSPKCASPMGRRQRIKTLMLRNLPIRRQPEDVFAHLAQLGFEGKFDFALFPMDGKTGMYLGYAFLNMQDDATAQQVLEKLPGTQLSGSHSTKILEVSAARQQGVQANLFSWRTSFTKGQGKRKGDNYSACVWLKSKAGTLERVESPQAI